MLESEDAGKSVQQMGHSKASVVEADAVWERRSERPDCARFVGDGREREGPDRGDWSGGSVEAELEGEEGGDKPAAWSATAGSMKYSSCSFSAFQL